MYWEGEYIHILIERNLVDVLSLLASTEARDGISALVDTPTTIEDTTHEYGTQSRERDAFIVDLRRLDLACFFLL